MSVKASSIYEGATYHAMHDEWHAPDGPGKARDIWPGMEDAISRRRSDSFTILEVGCGTGAVLDGLRALVREAYPDMSLRLAGLDISPIAIELGKERFPYLDLSVGDFLDCHEPVDAIVFCDVLEHLENPFEFLRHANVLSPVMILRQPLQGDLGIFRKTAYDDAIRSLGHIQFFNARSLDAIAAFTGWTPSVVELAAPWEMKTAREKPDALKAFLTKRARGMMSFLTSGFYINGSYIRR